MNQGRIWTVVSPNVGLPLFLGSVTVIALLVHAAVLTHTGWFGGYWAGSAKKTAMLDQASPASLASNAAPGVTISVAPVAGSGKGETSFVVTVAPSVAETSNQTLALATPSTK
jgi:light-harvesting protein B-800-850 alpha chain